MSSQTAGAGNGTRPLQVAYVVYRFHTGGLERCVSHLCNHLDRDRFQPHVICLTESAEAEGWLQTRDVEIHELHKRPRNDVRAVMRMRRLIQQRRFDVIHSHNWGTLLESVLACAGTFTAHVHAERGTILNQLERHGMRYQLRSRLMSWALKRCDALVSNAESTAARVREIGRLPMDSIEVIPNGIEAPFLSNRSEARNSIRHRLGISPSDYVLGSIGRLHRVKNFKMAIDAIADEPLASRNVHLILVGDGPERSALAAHASERNVARRVHLVGEQANVGDWLAAFDLFVNTSLSEGMSQSIVEAMAVGLPLVVTDVGDSAQLVGGEPACGLIVASENRCALIQAVCSAMNDPHRSLQLGLRAAQRHSERYSLSPMIRAYEALYMRLKAGRAPGGGRRNTMRASAAVEGRREDVPA